MSNEIFNSQFAVKNIQAAENKQQKKTNSD